MIVRVFRYPVKSMLGEELPRAVVTERGIEGDRVWALIDRTTGRVVSAKQPRKWYRMLTLAGRRTESDEPAVTVIFPSGREVSSDAADVDEALSAYLGRPVCLSTAVPEEATIDRLDPIVDGRQVLEERDRTETTDVLGQGAPKGTFFDYAPIHLVTMATLTRLQELASGSRFDAARFRPNLLLDLPSSGAFAENQWGGALLRVGAEVVLRVERPTPRCAIPTLAQPGLPHDLEIIRAIARHNTVSEKGGRRLACVGAYAQVLHGGVIEAGDRGHLEQSGT